MTRFARRAPVRRRCVRASLAVAGLLVLGLPALGQGGTAPAPAAGTPAAAPTGQGSLTIAVPQEGEYFVRLLPGPDAAQPAQLPVRFTDRTATITYKPTELGRSAKVAVDDARTGNTAIVPLDSIRDGRLTLLRSQFDHVRQVEVSITYDGRPVQVARVTLEPQGAAPRSRTVDATSRGLAAFEDVPAGKARLTVVYGDGLREVRDVEVTTDHAPGALSVPVAVTNRVPTLDAGAPSAAPSGTLPSASQPPPAPAQQPLAPSAGSGVVSLAGNLLGLAVAAGGIYMLYRWAQSGGLAATLRRAGIEVSGPQPTSEPAAPWEPNAAPAPIVADPSLCPFCGQRKDGGGNCACTLGSAVDATLAPAAAGQPRLVATVGAYAGGIFPIDPTGATVGRDTANQIALPDDTTVSRRHAAIRPENGAFTVTDEGSSNGVFVNGVRIDHARPLRPGDEVQIGATRFRFDW